MECCEILNGIIKILLSSRIRLRDYFPKFLQSTDENYIRKLRSDLRAIRFAEDGLMQPLVEYLESDERSVLQKLRRNLDDSSADMSRVEGELKSMSDKLGDKSIALEEQLKYVMSVKFGPHGIRFVLEEFAKFIEVSDIPESLLRHQVKALVSAMRQFNEDVNSLHRPLEDSDLRK